MVSCDDKNSILLLEKNLKHITSKVITEDSPYYGLDGYTEIRKNDQLDEVMNIINLFKPMLGLVVEELKVDIKVINVKNDNPIKSHSIFDYDNNDLAYCNISTILNVFRVNFNKITIFKCRISNIEYVKFNIDLSSHSKSDLTKFMDKLMSSFCIKCKGSDSIPRTAIFSLCSGYSNDNELKNVSFTMHRKFFNFDDEELYYSGIQLKNEYEGLIETLIK